jgi:hypothetical protein
MVEKGQERWRSWPRCGEYVIPPDDATMDERMAVMEMLTCEKYGIDPDNPPPLRRDVLRIIRRPDR